MDDSCRQSLRAAAAAAAAQEARAAAAHMRPRTSLHLSMALALLMLNCAVLGAEESASEELIFIEPAYAVPIDNYTSEVMVRLPKNTTSSFNCPGYPYSQIVEISSSAVDVLGDSWVPFELYQEYSAQLLPCANQTSCTLFVNPSWWDWEAIECPTCVACITCERSLRVTYRCPLEPLLAPAEPEGAAEAGASTPVGAVVGAVVGGLCAVAACLALWLLVRRRRQARQRGAAAAAAGGSSGSSGLGSKAPDAEGGRPPYAARASDLSLEELKELQARQHIEHSSDAVPLPARCGSLDGSAQGAALQPDGTLGLLSGGTSLQALARQVSAASGRSWGSSGTVDIKPWVLHFLELELHKRIGSGSYGAVFLAHWHQTEVAVKVLNGVGWEEELTLSNPLLAGLLTEATTMATLCHPCCVQFLGVCANPPCIVSEYCARGSLTDVLHQARTSRDPAAALSWARRLSIAAEAASGMAYLHSRAAPVVHRDLKSPNILIDGDWHAKISDYNLAKVMDGREPDISTSLAATNPRWLSPEVLQGGRATFASDVYAMGIILWELMTLEMPWAGQTNPFQIYKAVTSGRRPPLPADPDSLLGSTFPGLDRYLELMQECWSQQPRQRPTFAGITARLRAMQAACWPAGGA